MSVPHPVALRSSPSAARRRAPRVARLTALVAGLACGWIGGRPSADAGVVRTTDGLVLEGDVERAPDGSVAVTTADGVVRLAASRVASVDEAAGPSAALRTELAALAPADVDGRFRLALRAEAAGATGVAMDAYASVVDAAPDHAAARRALGHERLGDRWVPVAQARRARGLVLYEGAWRLPAEVEEAARGAAAPEAATVRADASVAEVMRTAAVGEPALARAAALRLLAVDATHRVATAKALLADAAPDVRAWACAHLAAAADESALRPLVFSAVRDRDPEVRAAAVAAAVSFGHDDVAVPFVKALGSEHPGLVANAARALATVGDARAVGAIVRRMISHGGGVRAVVEFLNKVSYIRDYDVEIAQAANIANPVIGTAVEGMVFDVKVVDVGMDRTVVEMILVDAFNKLTGLNARNVAEAVELYRARATTWPDFPKHPEPKRKAAVTPKG
jgi:hypothetical protein